MCPALRACSVVEFAMLTAERSQVLCWRLHAATGRLLSELPAVGALSRTAPTDAQRDVGRGKYCISSRELCTRADSAMARRHGSSGNGSTPTGRRPRRSS